MLVYQPFTIEWCKIASIPLFSRSNPNSTGLIIKTKQKQTKTGRPPNTTLNAYNYFKLQFCKLVEHANELNDCLLLIKKIIVVSSKLKFLYYM